MYISSAKSLISTYYLDACKDLSGTQLIKLYDQQSAKIKITGGEEMNSTTCRKSIDQFVSLARTQYAGRWHNAVFFYHAFSFIASAFFYFSHLLLHRHAELQSEVTEESDLIHYYSESSLP